MEYYSITKVNWNIYESIHARRIIQFCIVEYKRISNFFEHWIFHPLRVRGYWSIKLQKQFLSKSFQWKTINISYNNALKLCRTYTHIQFSTSVLLEAKSVLQLQLQILHWTINSVLVGWHFHYLWNNNINYIRWVIK